MPDKRKRKRKPYTLKQVMLVASQGIYTCENLILSPDTSTADRLRAINALSALMNSFTRTHEVHELEERIAELENNLRTNGKSITKEQG